jgi:hypothetical protein
MLSMNYHQGNSNQKYNEVLPLPRKNGCYQKLHITRAAEDVKKREPLQTVGENVNQYSFYGKPYECSSKT